MNRSLAVEIGPLSGTLAVDIDEDVILSGLAAVNGPFAVSKDATDTYSNTQSPSANTLNENLIATSTGNYFVPLKIPLSRGSRIFVNAKAAGTAILYFDAPS